MAIKLETERVSHLLSTRRLLSFSGKRPKSQKREWTAMALAQSISVISLRRALKVSEVQGPLRNFKGTFNLGNLGQGSVSCGTP